MLPYGFPSVECVFLWNFCTAFIPGAFVTVDHLLKAERHEFP